MTDLVLDDFHLKIRGARPQSYPPRQRISIDSALWRFDCPEYAPPYYVSPSVLKNDHTKSPEGWADPEDIEKFKITISKQQITDDAQRPLHPKGRTGIAGRGLLGRWGANPAVCAVIIRQSSGSLPFEILLGRQKDDNYHWLPKGFALRNQAAEEAMQSILQREFGWHPEAKEGEIFYQGFIYDDRQTDHAWVEVSTFLYVYTYTEAPTNFDADREFDEVAWLPLHPELLETLHPSLVNFVSEALTKLDRNADQRPASAVSGFHEEDSGR